MRRCGFAWFLAGCSVSSAFLGCSAQGTDVGSEVAESPSGAADAGAVPGPGTGGCNDCATDAGGSSHAPTRDAEAVDPPFEECAASRTEAERTLRPVDIVWVVDSSGSMRDEADIVQSNINGFVASLSNAGIDDYRVVMVTQKGFLDVPDPLGSDSARFLFIDERVNSNEPLQDLLARFDDYRGFLRPDAVTHFVVVTDDESDLSASQFLSQMGARLGHQDFKVHAVASENVTHEECFLIFCNQVEGCKSATNEAAAIGHQHYAAAEATGGLTFSICTENWDSLFTELAEVVSVAAPIPCELLVPEPPAGETLDPNLVNVVFTPSGASEGEAIPRVSGSDVCGDGGGWYYDVPEAPTRIHLCPASCTSAEAGGAVDIALGCATIVK